MHNAPSKDHLNHRMTILDHPNLDPMCHPRRYVGGPAREAIIALSGRAHMPPVYRPYPRPPLALPLALSLALILVLVLALTLTCGCSLQAAPIGRSSTNL